MAYAQQIRILEARLVQLRNKKLDQNNMVQTWSIEAEIRRLKRLEWEETHERVKLDDERY